MRESCNKVIPHKEENQLEIKITVNRDFANSIMKKVFGQEIDDGTWHNLKHYSTHQPLVELKDIDYEIPVNECEAEKHAYFFGISSVGVFFNKYLIEHQK